VGARSVPFSTRAAGDLARPQSERAMSLLTDEEVALRARDESAAFALLYDRYVDRVYRYVRYRTSDPRDAEDLTSDVFFRALRAIGRYSPRAPFYAWIYKIARNAVIDHRRAGRAEVPLTDVDPTDPAPSLDPERNLMAGDRRACLARALAHLAEDQQEVIVLRFIEGLTPEECAQVVGKRPAAVRDIQFRALRALRSHITPEELAS
jgi:RNA polymerase sigma-70 factor (ECF subfamily)